MPDIQLRDGDIIKGDGFTFEAVHTPGHTSNHICYALKEERALFSGDHVMGWSTRSWRRRTATWRPICAVCEKLLSRDEQIYWPTHGGPIRDPNSFVSALLRHRLSRETEILSAVNDGCRRIPEIVGRVYSGLDPRLLHAAELNVLAHLLKLIQEARVIAEGEGLNADYEARCMEHRKASAHRHVWRSFAGDGRNRPAILRPAGFTGFCADRTFLAIRDRIHA